MIKLYILFPGLIIAFCEIIFALKMFKNNNELGIPLMFHGFVMIFVSFVLTFAAKEMLLFIAIFYIFTLIWLCGVRINQKKKKINSENQKLYDEWK